MVLDQLANTSRYVGLHPLFARAFAFLADVRALPPGRHDIDGDRLFVLMQEENGRGHKGARLEAHRAHIDIQLTLDGIEEIGWSPLAACRPAGEHNREEDIAFFDDRPHVWFTLPPGHLAVFFPQDAHAPLGGMGKCRKAVVKVAIDR
ncbi:MAG: YhcH/YjgK/YiaL family protein [Vicinamibacterales bacterium]